MDDWNVVVTVRDDGYAHARRALLRIGALADTPLFNVLVMRTDSVRDFLTSAAELFHEDPGLSHDVSRILPLTHSFELGDPADFDRRCRQVALGWLDQLAGRSFHVRLHRRGDGAGPSHVEQEHQLDQILLDELEARGTPGTVSFDNPDVIIDIEAVGRRAGMALWARADLESYPFLRVD